jgi:hypothetical protein
LPRDVTCADALTGWRIAIPRTSLSDPAGGQT